MPTYIYKFIETGETIEVQQAFTDASLTEAVHPGSGSTMPVKKVFTPVGVTFKGGGFYKTDSRGGKPSYSTATSSKDSGGDKAASSNGSSDSSSSGSSSSESTGAAAPAAAAAASTPAKSSSD